MTIIIRLQNLPLEANALDIRQFFQGLIIPDGGVHIVGGEKGDAFIAFSSDEDARRAMLLNGAKIFKSSVTLLLSSKIEMQNVITSSRAQASHSGANDKTTTGASQLSCKGYESLSQNQSKISYGRQGTTSEDNFVKYTTGIRQADEHNMEVDKKVYDNEEKRYEAPCPSDYSSNTSDRRLRKLSRSSQEYLSSRNSGYGGSFSSPKNYNNEESDIKTSDSQHVREHKEKYSRVQEMKYDKVSEIKHARVSEVKYDSVLGVRYRDQEVKRMMITDVEHDRMPEVKHSRMREMELDRLSKRKYDRMPEDKHGMQPIVIHNRVSKEKLDIVPEEKYNRISKEKYDKLPTGKCEKVVEEKYDRMPKVKLDVNPKEVYDRGQELKFNACVQGKYTRAPEGKRDRVPEVRYNKVSKGKYEIVPEIIKYHRILEEEYNKISELHRMSDVQYNKVPAMKYRTLSEGKYAKVPEKRHEQVSEVKPGRLTEAKSNLVPDIKQNRIPEMRHDLMPEMKLHGLREVNYERRPEVKRDFVSDLNHDKEMNDSRVTKNTEIVWRQSNQVDNAQCRENYVDSHASLKNEDSSTKDSDDSLRGSYIPVISSRQVPIKTSNQNPKTKLVYEESVPTEWKSLKDPVNITSVKSGPGDRMNKEIIYSEDKGLRIDHNKDARTYIELTRSSDKIECDSRNVIIRNPSSELVSDVIESEENSLDTLLPQTAELLEFDICSHDGQFSDSDSDVALEDKIICELEPVKDQVLAKGFDINSSMSKNESCCVRISNLPKSFNYREVRRTFAGCGIPKFGLKLVNDKLGFRTGSAYIQFDSLQQRDSALLFNRKLVNGCKIVVAICTEEEYNRAIDNYCPKYFIKPSSDVEIHPSAIIDMKSSAIIEAIPEAEFEPDVGPNPAVSYVKSLELNEGFFIVIKKLPIGLSMTELKILLEEICIAPNGGPYFESSSGVRTGNALVELRCHNDLLKALLLHKTNYKGSLISVIRLNAEEYKRRLINSGEEMAVRKREMNTGKQHSVLGQKRLQDSWNRDEEPKRIRLDDRQNEPTCCAFLRGLPFNATLLSVEKFFVGIQIVENGIHMETDANGVALGRAYVEFENLRELEKGLARNGNHMGKRFIEVLPCCREKMNCDITYFKKHREGLNRPSKEAENWNDSLFGEVSAFEKYRDRFCRQSENYRVHLSNLHIDTQLEDILDFLRGWHPVDGSIKMRYCDGLPTGDGHVAFRTREEADSAILELNKKFLLGRPIILRPWMDDD